jgi:alpha-glucosidase (family GH31 glycosyl hydrolase)
MAEAQELYRWPSVAAAGRRALGLRYRLLTYLYSHFHRAAAEAAPVARPLWFEFPADAAALAADGQWLLGDAVLVSPVLEQARL